MAEERLQKVIAHAGICSRRKAEELITAGRVVVNGEVVTVLGTTVDPLHDEVVVDGVSIAAEALEYWALHKPRGVVSTSEDTHDRPTVVDLVPTKARLYPVGRLDIDTTGLIIMTNDGVLAERLMHPRHEQRKVYEILVSGYPSAEVLGRLTAGRGIQLEDGLARALRWRELRSTPDGKWLEIVLGEGRKRQLRRMFEALGYPVVHLRRVAVGPVRLGRLAEGESRRLSERELRALRVLDTRGRPRRRSRGDTPRRKAGR